VAYLDSILRRVKNGIKELETGTIAVTVVYPRKVAEPVLLRGVRAIILVHDHPTGSVEPSDSDEHSTKMLKIALQYLDIISSGRKVYAPASRAEI
jgi:DNA repair protein RadC